jgi:hypothetical protein
MDVSEVRKVGWELVTASFTFNNNGKVCFRSWLRTVSHLTRMERCVSYYEIPFCIRIRNYFSLHFVKESVVIDLNFLVNILYSEKFWRKLINFSFCLM